MIARGGRTRAFVESFALLEAVAGSNPSRADKSRINEAVLNARNVVEKLLDRVFLEKGVAGLLGVSAAANAVDVEMLEYRFEGGLVDVLGEEPEYRFIDAKVLEELRGARVAFLLDNAGEAVVDMLVASRLVETGASVTLYARSLEYETDVTEEEARLLAEKLGVRLEVRGSGGRYPPHHPRSETRRELEDYDFVVTKGIANFETMLEAPLQKPRLIALLRAKCTPLSRLLNVDKGRPVIVNPRMVPLRLRA